jgi:dTDP-4-dehydrorhamnose 3,5-epimerase
VKFCETPIAGAWLIDLDRIQDERGYFARAWCRDELAKHGLNAELSQANVGYSKIRGTIRGMHYQLEPMAEVKLVRCTRGAIYDVLLDLRPDSPTYCQWYAHELTAENSTMLYIPEGCAHGCQALADGSEFFYFASRPFSREHSRGVRYDDSAFQTRWPLEVTEISAADRSWPDFTAMAEARSW